MALLINRYLKKKDKKDDEIIRPRGLLIDKYITPETKKVIEETPKKRSLADRIKGIGTGIRKFAARTGIEAANLVTSTLDFAADFLVGQVGKQIEKPVVGISGITKPTRQQTNLATKWKDFYVQTGGEVTEKMKAFTEDLRGVDFIKPSEEWTNASTKDKFTKKLPETILNIGPGVVSSLAMFAINPAVGFAVSAGSVADELKTVAMENGVNEERAELLGLGTGLLVGWLDKIVPDEVFSPQQKKTFVSGFAKRILKTGLKEAGTEILQEDIQLLAEATVREDITKDEVITRNLMSGLGGVLGGVGAQTTVSFVNGVRSGDIGGLEEDFEVEKVEKPAKLIKVEKVPVAKPIKKIPTKEVAEGGLGDITRKYKNADELAKAFGDKGVEIPISSIAPESIDPSPIRERVDEYKQMDKATRPPVKVFVIDEEPLKFNLEDGNARVVAAMEKGEKTIRAIADTSAKELQGLYRKSSVVQPPPSVEKKVVVKTKPKAREITEKQIKTTKNIKDTKTTLRKIQAELSEAVVEAEASAIIAQEKRSGVNIEDINKLKRIYANNKKFQEGDIETIRKSRTGGLLNRVVENVQEIHPEMSEQEALDFALELPTKAEEAFKTPTTRELEKKQKKLSRFMDLLKARQSELKIEADAELSREWTQALAVEEKLEKIVRVPKRQLPVGEGKEKVSRLQARLKGALENTSQEDIEELGLTTFRQMNQEDQIAKASEYVENNTEEALKVVRGEIDPPEGILQNSVFAALVELGKVDTDVATQVATLTATRFGQEINILKKILADNPVVMMQDIVKARIEAYEKRTGRKVSGRIKQETAKITKKVKPTTKEQWNLFIESIRC